MKNNYLFPTWGGLVGYLLAIPGFILGYFNIIKQYQIPGFGFKMREKDGFFQAAFENFTNELVVFMVVIGLLLIAFSKNKREDELSAKLRLNSLYWSVMIYYIIYHLGYVFMWTVEKSFLSEHILEINIFMPLLIFIIRFYYLKYSNHEQYRISTPKFLPNKPYRLIGIGLTLVGFTVLIPSVILDALGNEYDLIQIISYFTLVVGLFIWSFSKNKVEDEMVMQQRLESLQLAVYFNYVILLVATLIAYSVLYLLVMLFAQFSLLLYFVIRMEYVRYKNNKILNTFEGEIGS